VFVKKKWYLGGRPIVKSSPTFFYKVGYMAETDVEIRQTCFIAGKI